MGLKTLSNRDTVISQSSVPRAAWIVPAARYGMPLLLFCWLFLFLLFYIDPAIIYSSNGMSVHDYVETMHKQHGGASTTQLYKAPPIKFPLILEMTPEYLSPIAASPGGLTLFVATLCLYSCHHAILGAIILTGVAIVFCLVFFTYLKKTGVDRPYMAVVVPPLFIVMTCVRYDLNNGTFLLPVVGALILAIVYQCLAKNASIVKRVVGMCILFWCLWYLMQWGALLLLLFIIIHELRSSKANVVPVIFAAAINAVMFLMIDTWFIPPAATTRWWYFTEQLGLPIIMIGYFPIVAFVLTISGSFLRSSHVKTTVTRPVINAVVTVSGIVAVSVWSCAVPVNRDTRTIARTVHHVLNKQWEAVLDEDTKAMFEGFPQNAGALQAFMVHAKDRALYHTGQFGDKLFTFPQATFSYDPLLLLHTISKNGHVNWVMVLDLAMELGMVNTAEKIAGELMENMGAYPEIVYRRALIQIAKGNSEAASVYLKKLSGMALYKKKAERLLCSNNTAALFSDPRIASMRANRDTTDYYLFTISYTSMLKYLLQSNPGNKMAYDYLMSLYLLNGQLDGFASLILAAPVYGYTSLPRYWGEALCVNQAANPNGAMATAALSWVRPETVDRFNTFAQRYLQLANDPEVADKLAPAFGDSYFFFSIFKYTRGTHHD